MPLIFFCAHFCVLVSIFCLWYENSINKWSKLFKRFLVLWCLMTALSIKWYPAIWIYWTSNAPLNFLNHSFYNSFFFKYLWNVIIEYINIYTCKHFYGTCLDFSRAFCNPYRCYYVLVLVVEKRCTFVTFSYVKPSVLILYHHIVWKL